MTHTNRTLHQIMIDVNNGLLEIEPRPYFNWRQCSVTDLLDSVYRGYPIGSVVFHAKACGVVRILDGYHRLVSLTQSLSPTPHRGFDSCWFEVYFDLNRRHFTHDPAEWQGHMFPIRCLRNTADFLLHTSHLSMPHVNLLEDMADRFNCYKVPVSVLRDVDDETIADMMSRLTRKP